MCILCSYVHSARTTDANANAAPRRSTVAFLRPAPKTESIEVDSDQARSPSFAATTAAPPSSSSSRPSIKIKIKTEGEEKQAEKGTKLDAEPRQSSRSRKGKRKLLSALSTASSSPSEIAPARQSDISTDFSSLSEQEYDSSPSASFSADDTSHGSSSEEDDDDDDDDDDVDASAAEDTSSSSSHPTSAPITPRTAPKRAAAQRASLSWKKAMLQRVEPVWRTPRSSSNSSRRKRSPRDKAATPRRKKMTTLMLAQRALQVDRDAREELERKRVQRQQQDDGKEKEKEAAKEEQEGKEEEGEGEEEKGEMKEQREIQEKREKVPLVTRIEHRSTCPPELEGSRVWAVFSRYEQHYWELVHAGVPPNSAKPFRLTKEDSRMLSEREKNQFRYLRDRFQKKKDQLQHRERRKREKRRKYSQWRQENEEAPDQLNKYRIRSWRAQLSIKLSKALLKRRISWDGWTHRDEVRMAYFLSLPQRSQTDKLLDRYLRYRTEAEKTAAREAAAAETATAGEAGSNPPPTGQVP